MMGGALPVGRPYRRWINAASARAMGVGRYPGGGSRKKALRASAQAAGLARRDRPDTVVDVVVTRDPARCFPPVDNPHGPEIKQGESALCRVKRALQKTSGVIPARPKAASPKPYSRDRCLCVPARPLRGPGK